MREGGEEGGRGEREEGGREGGERGGTEWRGKKWGGIEKRERGGNSLVVIASLRPWI